MTDKKRLGFGTDFVCQQRDTLKVLGPGELNGVI
jgi:hypothetical protein